MAVIHGSASDAYFNGYNLGDGINSCKSSHQKDLQEVTVFNNAGAKTYHGNVIKSGSVEASGFYDSIVTDDTDMLDYALSAAVNNQSAVTDQLLYFPYGANTLADRGIAFQGYVDKYDIGSPNDAMTDISMSMTGCHGREPVLLLAARAARTDSFTGSSIDNGASSANGGAGFLQVFDWTSGSVPVLIEHSTDNSVWSTLITFTAVGADHAKERIAVTGTVNRYIRASANGTYVANFLVAFNRK